MYKKRDSIRDKKIPVTITIDSSLAENLRLLRDKNKLKTLSGRINDLLWTWFQNEIKTEEKE